MRIGSQREGIEMIEEELYTGRDLSKNARAGHLYDRIMDILSINGLSDTEKRVDIVCHIRVALETVERYIPRPPEGYLTIPVGRILREGDLKYNPITGGWEPATGSWAKAGAYYARREA